MGVSNEAVACLLRDCVHLTNLVLHSPQTDVFTNNLPHLFTSDSGSNSSNFVFPALETLGLNGCHGLTNEDFTHLAAIFPNLTRLSVTGIGSQVTQQGIEALQTCPLTFLCLVDCPFVSNQALEALVTRCPVLRDSGRLALRNCPALTLEGLLELPESLGFWYEMQDREDLQEMFDAFG